MPRDGLTPAERAHLREHRRGAPPKIDGDPEVRAFVQAQLGTSTFDQIAAAARATFGAGRAPARTTIHRWFVANRRRLAAPGTAASEEKMSTRRHLPACLWCDRPFRPVRRGPHDKRFCSTGCRAAFHVSCGRYGARLFDLGLITVDDLWRVGHRRQRVVYDGETASDLGSSAPPSSRSP